MNHTPARPHQEKNNPATPGSERCPQEPATRLPVLRRLLATAAVAGGIGDVALAGSGPPATEAARGARPVAEMPDCRPAGTGGLPVYCLPTMDDWRDDRVFRPLMPLASMADSSPAAGGGGLNLAYLAAGGGALALLVATLAGGGSSGGGGSSSAGTGNSSSPASPPVNHSPGSGSDASPPGKNAVPPAEDSVLRVAARPLPVHLTGADFIAVQPSLAIANAGQITAADAHEQEPGSMRKHMAILVDGLGHGGLDYANDGTLEARGGYGILITDPRTAGAVGQTAERLVANRFRNRGRIDFHAERGTRHALRLQHDGHDALNDSGSTLTVHGYGAVAMYSDGDGRLENLGTINLGSVGTTDTHMTAMKLGPNASHEAVITNNGVINIHANKSHAFGILSGNSQLLNIGEVNLLCPHEDCGVFSDWHTEYRKKQSQPGLSDTGPVLRLHQSQEVRQPYTIRAGGHSHHMSLAGSFVIKDGGQFVNHGRLIADHAVSPAGGSASPSRGAILREDAAQGGAEHRNEGRMKVDGGYQVFRSDRAKTVRSRFINRGGIEFHAVNSTMTALQVSHAGHDVVNDAGGILTLTGNNAVGLFSDSDSLLENRGILNLGTPGTTDTGMVAMHLGPKSTHQAKLLNTGTINIYAGKSHAFHIDNDSNGSLVNQGKVNYLCGDKKSCSDHRSEHTRKRSRVSSDDGSYRNLTVREYQFGPVTLPADGPLLRLSSDATFYLKDNGAFTNHGKIVAAEAARGPLDARLYGYRAILSSGWSPGVLLLNTGTLTASDGYGVLRTVDPVENPRTHTSTGRNRFINRGVIDFTATERSPHALYAAHAGHDFLNDKGGVITVRGNGAVAMRSDGDGNLINRGVINVGEAGSMDSNMMGMVLGPGALAVATLINDKEGVINVHGRESFAFHIADGNMAMINRGKVNLLCPAKDCAVFSGAHEQSVHDVTNVDLGSSYEYAFHFPDQIDPQEPASSRATRLAGYVVGTRPDGQAGTLSGGHLDASGVTVDTGFVAGTTARQARFAKVLRGERIDGIEQIRSRSAAWRAQAWRDADGDVGVTLTKNDYRELAPDAALRPLAAALEQDYDGSELFRSLELGSAADIGHALRQLSGAGIRSALKPLQTLEQRFVRLGHDMAETRAGFGLQLVGSRHGRPEARLGRSAYDLVVLRQRFAPGGAAQLTARYGFASLRPGATAADAGLAGHSQLFGLDYAQPLGRGPTLEGEFRYAQHRFDTRRTLRYGSVDLRPQASQRRDRFSGRFALVLAPQRFGGLALAPLLGLTVHHQRDAALTERNAGVYALRLSAARASAVEGVFGLRVRHEAVDARHGRGWRVDAELLGRPTLYRQAAVRQARFASLPSGGRFTLAADRARFGYGGRLSLGFHGRDSRLDLGAHIGRDAVSGDHGVTARYQRVF